MRKLIAAAAIAAFMAGPALADSIEPAEPWNSGNPGNEYNLYEIYNHILNDSFGGGGTYTSNAELNSLQVSDDEFFTLAGDAGEITAAAHFAYYAQTFGWYTDDGSGGITENELFTVTSRGFLDPASNTHALNASGEFGFYDSIGFLTWYSDPSQNQGMEDHLVVYQVDGFEDTFVLAWEDIPLEMSDMDYNDLVLTVYLGSQNIVPEPTSMLLVGMGVAGLMVRRIRGKH